jgi:ADP-heptose:LPS heptosyltransferase
MMETRPQRIVIVRALPGLGDFLCCVPAWRALRAALPEAHITLLGLPGSEALRQRFRAYLDDFLQFPGFPGIAERPPDVQALPRFLSEVQGSFDLALQMHGSGGVSNIFTMLLGARHAAGFYVPGQYCPDPDSFLPYPEHLSELRCYLSLVASLGAAPCGAHLEFPVTQADRQAYATLSGQHGLTPGSYVCLHPGASTPERRWPAASFAALGDWFGERGLRVVLTGTAGESDVTRAVARQMRHQPLDLTGQTGLGALSLLLTHARLLLCNDTGVSHLAAATATPSVVLFIETDPYRWAPENSKRHRAVCVQRDDSGSPDSVIAAAQQLLQRHAEVAYAL